MPELSNMSEIIIYEDPKGITGVEVRFEGDTLWLSQDQMTMIFERDRSVITRHINNIFRDAELDEKSNVQLLHVANSDKPVKFYGLDVALAVGYRVNSRRGIQFRQWATRVLREHLLQGFTLNQSRLAELGINEAQQALELLTRTLHANALVNDTGKEVLALIAGYAKTGRLLLQYDEQAIPLPPGCRPAQGVLSYEKARIAIDRLKADLISRSEATPLFGNARGEALDGILGSIEQTDVRRTAV
jgi:hypothetical protein